MNKLFVSPKRVLRFAAPLSLLLAANLHAAMPMSISLKGSDEVPPVKTMAAATGSISVATDHSVSGSIKVSGIVPTMAHIHEGTVGKNGPPIVTLTKSADNSFVVPAETKLTDAQYASYEAGNLYVNVHSEAHPDGEIRAQLAGK